MKVRLIAAAAVCALVALTVGALVVANPLSRLQLGSGVRPTPTSQPEPTADSSLPAFTCLQPDLVTKLTSRAISTLPVVLANGLRTTPYATYDRLVLDFKNGLPKEVDFRSNARGTIFPTAQGSFSVVGTRGIELTLLGAALNTSYSGSTDIVTAYSTLAEVRVVLDFKGVVQLAIGINGYGRDCYRALFLTNPNRLMIDVQASRLPTTCTARTFDAPDSKAPVALIRGLTVSRTSVLIGFSNGAPIGHIDIRPQTGTKFTPLPGGIEATLAGTNGILVTFHGADMHSAYNGPADFWNDGPNLVEVRKVQDFKGVVQLALGIDGPACYSVDYGTFSGGSSLSIGIPASAPLYPAPDPGRLTATNCSGQKPATPPQRFDNYTMNVAPGWEDTRNNAATESRAAELSAPPDYGNRPTLIQLHQFPSETAESAHSVAVEWAPLHPLMSDQAITSAISDCTIGGDAAAAFGYADGAQVGFWIWIVHKTLIHGIRLVGANGISNQAMQDALGMIGSITWNL